MNCVEGCTAAGNKITQLLVSRKGISILQTSLKDGKWPWIMRYIQEFSITETVGPCRMFILSKCLQLGSTLKNYFSVKCLQEPLLWKEISFQHTNPFAHIHTLARSHTQIQIQLVSDSEVTRRGPLTFTPTAKSYCYFSSPLGFI